MNTNKLPIIQSLWIGKELSVMERLCITSFLKNDHPFHLYVYDEVKNIPPSTVVKDASEILTPDKIFKYKKEGSYSGFSNMFRYKLLLEKGGYWVDSDVVCLAPFDDEAEYVFANVKRDKLLRKAGEVQSCIIKTPAGAKILDYCYRESVKRNPEELKWGETGPVLLNEAIKKFDLLRYIDSGYTFCPIDYLVWNRFINGSLIRTTFERAKMRVFGTKAVHLWHEMWRQNGMDPNARFPERSIYEQLKRRYSVS